MRIEVVFGIVTIFFGVMAMVFYFKWITDRRPKADIPLNDLLLMARRDIPAYDKLGLALEFYNDVDTSGFDKEQLKRLELWLEDKSEALKLRIYGTSNITDTGFFNTFGSSYFF